jgi:hypothetical protein
MRKMTITSVLIDGLWAVGITTGHLLTPHGEAVKVLLEKLLVCQLLRKFPPHSYILCR